MPLGINGYNDAFKAFTDFATQSVEAGKSKAVARAGGDAQPRECHLQTVGTLFKWCNLFTSRV